MPHQRTLIRRAARDRLLNLVPALRNVFKTRINSYELDELPAVSVYAGSEQVDEDSYETSPRELMREVDLSFKCVLKKTDNFVAQHNGDLDDALDSFALAVERAIDNDETLGGNADDCVLERTVMEIKDEGDQEIGEIVLTYRATYTTNSPESTDGLDNFNYADMRHSLDGGAVIEPNQAHDVITDLYTP